MLLNWALSVRYLMIRKQTIKAHRSVCQMSSMDHEKGNNSDEALVKSKNEAEKVIKPNRAAWLSLLGASVILFATTSYLSAFSLLYKSKLTSLALDRGATSVGAWTFQVFVTTWNLLSLFSGPVVNASSHRFTSFCGAALICAGVVLSAFARAPADLILSAGLVVGCGTGLVTNPSVLLVTTHFAPTRHLGLSVGVLFVAMGAGGIVVPIIISSISPNIQDNFITIFYGLFVGIFGAIGTIFYISPKEARNNKKKFLQSIEWRLLLRPDFLLASCGSSGVLVCALNFYRVAPMMAEELGDGGGNGASSAKVLAIFNCFDLVARFLACWVGDWKIMKASFVRPRKAVFITGGFLLGIVLICMPWLSSYGELCAVAAIIGAAVGSVYSNGPLVYQESFPDSVDSALGISCALRAVFSMALAPIMDLINKHDPSPPSALLWLSGGISCTLMSTWVIQEMISPPKKGLNQPS